MKVCRTEQAKDILTLVMSTHIYNSELESLIIYSQFVLCVGDTWVKVPTVPLEHKIVQISDVLDNCTQARTGFDERSNVARDFNVYTLMNRVNVYILVVYARVRGLVKIDIFLKIQVTVQRLGKRQRHFNHQETFNTSNNQTDDTFSNYNFQE